MKILKAIGFGTFTTFLIMSIVGVMLMLGAMLMEVVSSYFPGIGTDHKMLVFIITLSILTFSGAYYAMER